MEAFGRGGASWLASWKNVVYNDMYCVCIGHIIQSASTFQA